MTLDPNQVIFKDEHGRQEVTRRPVWANDDKLVMSDDDVELFNNTEFSLPEHLEFRGAVLEDVMIVFRGEGDIIFHFPKIRHKDFKNLLSAVVESHFNTMDPFRVDHIPEMKLWSMLAKNVRTNPLFNMKHYVEDFLWLLDGTLEADLKE